MNQYYEGTKQTAYLNGYHVNTPLKSTWYHLSANQALSICDVLHEFTTEVNWGKIGSQFISQSEQLESVNCTCDYNQHGHQ